MSEPPFDRSQAHRWFAIELNNLAWDLLESPARTAEETDKMIHAAHAACFHWLQVGNEVNHLRAENLLATVYVQAKNSVSAVQHAERCLELAEKTAGSRSQFDVACAHGCAAAAYELAGDDQAAIQQRTAFQQAADSIDDADERRLLADLYGVE